MKRVLLIAYHYPPMVGSSGVQRAYRFAQYLPDFAWSPLVLTAHPRAYPAVSDANAPLPDVPVRRAFALDSAKHLAIAGRYPGLLARPDRWRSWWLGGVLSGLSMIRRYRPSALWSTYPIPTAHVIAHTLARLSGLPWVADFRDPMAHEGYPEDPQTWKRFLQVEQKVFRRAAAASFTTRGALQLYADRYRDSSTRLVVIPNGYDDAAFVDAERTTAELGEAHGGRGQIVLLHSGVVYPQWRNPQMLFRAFRQLVSEGGDGAERLVIRFRASAHDAFVRRLATEEGVGDRVEILGELDYRHALREMTQAQGLLLLQNHACNDQVPAKMYEYFRARRPILALTDPSGDTAAEVARRAGHVLADLGSATSIHAGLRRWLRELSLRPGPLPWPDGGEDCSRRGRTGLLADLLNSVTH